MLCRPRCAACCIAPSISTPIPAHAGVAGLPEGKPAGQRCPQLDADDRCRLFGHPHRPAVCASLKPSLEMCGNGREQAMHWLQKLETATGPTAPPYPPGTTARLPERPSQP